ncbi:hypothetical protein BC938DRAFT_475395 [Jimgerdemannia flammicorona]|uniref:Histone-lysine N-methyltransferase SET5 n=1 Tax=Jimgerdemannia flammicorona TaxID=994334 RepID=A0A433PVN4_9FUNG|nr:hypothetical protein BC938DRAFT_475395 [Jimgerdemannia flammicorona]
MIDRITGKGLFATRDLKKDEIIFEETPLAFFPGWTRHDDVLSGYACGLCAKPLNTGRVGSSLIVRCPHCDMTYCTKLCRQTAWDTFHRLECTNVNPRMRVFLDLCRAEDWSAAVGVERCWAHLILASERGELEAVRAQYEAFATVSQAERQAKETAWIFMEHTTRELWTRTLSLLSAALTTPPPKSKLKNPLPADLLSTLFTEASFLSWLGRWNINNQNGGLYRLQSHLNHACSPTVSIEHPVAGSSYRLAVRVIRDVKKGEQVCETYVNPSWNKETRKNFVSTNYMFECACERCERDEGLTEEVKRGLRLTEK